MSMLTRSSYLYLTTHLVPGPQSISYFVPFILLPIALLTPRSTLSRWQSISLFMPVIVFCTVHSWLAMRCVDVISVNALLWAFFLIALQDPWKNFILIRTKATGPRDGATKVDSGPRTVDSDPCSKYLDVPYPSKFWERVSWVGWLLASIRLDNWKISRPSHDKLQPPRSGFENRTDFLLHSLLSFLRGYIVLDLTSAYISQDAYFTNLSISIDSPLGLAGLGLVPPRAFRALLVGLQCWALISQMFYLPASLPVALNAVGLVPDVYSPHTWPPYFGPIRAVFEHGVRGFWGSFWHQTMRWTVSGPGYALADGLRLRRNGLLRYMIISLSAFGFSGIVHMGLVPPKPLQARVSADTIRYLVAGFFWMQPIAMLIETMVERTTKRIVRKSDDQQGGMGLRKVANFIWTVCWFSLCLPLLTEAGRQLGYWNNWPVPVSVWKGVHGEGWVVWGLPDN